MTPTVKCPACGAQTSGKFCSECGQPLAGRTCTSCHAPLSAKAKFCPECGTPSSAATRAPASAPGPAPASAGPLGDKFPWIIAGTAVLALVATLIVATQRREGGGGQPAASGAPGSGTPPDLSTMTPREAADRLYERVARAASAGDTQQVAFFGPMAVNAYANVSPVDADVRLHVGLIQLNMGNTAAGIAQADSIEQISRTHLFAPAIRMQAASVSGDRAALQRAARAFLANETAERAKNLAEYGDHETLLTDLRATAQSARP